MPRLLSTYSLSRTWRTQFPSTDCYIAYRSELLVGLGAFARGFGLHGSGLMMMMRGRRGKGNLE